MPQRKQPATLFDIALPITALRLRDQCDAILRSYDDVTESPFKQRIESFNYHLRKEVPHNVLDRLRQHENLAVFIYLGFTSLRVQGKTLRNTPIHQHLTHNVIPRLDRVTLLDLSEVEGTLDLFRAISSHCPELQSIFINTDLGREESISIPFTGDDVGIWLLLLTRCKKLEVLQNTCFDLGFNVFDSNQLQNSVASRVLQQLPELKEFKCDLSSIIAQEEMLTGVYKITQLEIDAESHLLSAENIQWMNIHCPFINQVVVSLMPIDDTILQALANTDWKIKSLEFEDIAPKFGEAMKTFFTIKGVFLENLAFTYDEESLSYDDIVFISQSCPALKRLAFLGDWYNGDALTPFQRRTKCLFPNIDCFSMFVSQNPVIPVILEELLTLKELECFVKADMTLAFMNHIEGLRNTFTQLTEVKIMLFDGTPISVSTFVLRFVPIAIGWMKIRRICVIFYEDDLLPEAKQYLEGIRSTILEQNLDVNLSIGHGPSWVI